MLARCKARRYDEESLELAARLLALNPEIYTVWNFRRDAVADVLAAGGADALAASARELAVTQRALMRNPKSYAAWHHRRWVVGHRLDSLEAEMALVEKLLEADDRNFHGWGYRLFIAKVHGTCRAVWDLGVGEWRRDAFRLCAAPVGCVAAFRAGSNKRAAPIVPR